MPPKRRVRLDDAAAPNPAPVERTQDTPSLQSTWPTMMPLVLPPTSSTTPGPNSGVASSSTEADEIWYVRKGLYKRRDPTVAALSDDEDSDIESDNTTEDEEDSDDVDATTSSEPVDATPVSEGGDTTQMSVGEAGESSNGPAKKKKKGGRRGFVSTARTLMEVEQKGKFRLEYHGGLVCPDHPEINHKRVTRDIGSIIRAHLPMKASVWDKVLVEERKKLEMRIRCLYLYTDDDEEVCEYIQSECRRRYKDWKSKINSARNAQIKKKTTPTNPNPKISAPMEFKNRLDEWKWLCDHFDSPEFKDKSDKAVAARKKVKTKQRGGSCSIRDHAAAILAKDASNRTPLLAACAKVFPLKDKNKHNRIKGRKIVLAMKEVQESCDPSFIGPVSDLIQAEALAAKLGVQRKGSTQPGCGKRIILPTPKEKRSSSTTAPVGVSQGTQESVAQIEDRVRADIERRFKEQEERMAAKQAELDESLRKVREILSGITPPQPNSDGT